MIRWVISIAEVHCVALGISVGVVPLAEFDTDGDVEIVQNLETLQYGVESRILLRSRVLVECGTNEAGGRGNVARKS